MYRKSAQGWLKHWDFMCLDVICLQLAFILSCFTRLRLLNPYKESFYCTMAVGFILCQLVVTFFCQSYKDVLRRGYYIEFTKTVKHVGAVMLLSMFYLFVTQQSNAFSRIIFFITAIIYLGVSYIARLILKKLIISRNIKENTLSSMIVVSAADEVEQTLKKLLSRPVQNFAVTGIAVLDEGFQGTSIAGIPVIGDTETVKDYLCHEWVDEVFVKIPEKLPYPHKLINEIVLMGITVHLSINSSVELAAHGKQFVERIGGYSVITSSINTATSKQMFYKRLMDIAGGLVGCILTLILTVIIGPMIYVKSPEPIFFSQVRIGKNGKKFKIYKFRSMYMDAEQRKAELMSQNKMDGLMFKMDYDPRIIGCEKKDKNGNPKGIGNFIRKTSLDEFPQFWNVLKGDMSLVGTRPPTVDEWEQYELHHRSRMSIKPGITGMWQVSGRSDITDFEEVVRLDNEYIENWSVELDIKILLKTVFSVLKSEGSV